MMAGTIVSHLENAYEQTADDPQCPIVLMNHTLETV